VYIGKSAGTHIRELVIINCLRGTWNSKVI